MDVNNNDAIMPKQPIRIFFAYHKKDEGHKKALDRHLATLLREGSIAQYESAATAENWGWSSDNKEINADIILFLLSADFLADDALSEKQIQQAMQRHAEKQSLVLGVLLRDCDYLSAPYAERVRFPRKQGAEKPTSIESEGWSSPDEAYTEVVDKIKEAASFIRKQRARNPAHFDNEARLDISTRIDRDASGGFTKNIRIDGNTGGDGVNISQSFSNSGPFPFEAPPQKQEKRKIVFLAANPSDLTQLQLPKEAKSIQDGLRQSNHREDFEFRTHFEVRTTDILNILLNESPEMVHFSGHGSGDKGLHFQNLMGTTQLVSTEALAALFKELKDSVKCVLLNACYAEKQAQAVAEHIPYVIGMKDAIGDVPAIFFATGFYNALASGKGFAEAFRLARVNILLQGIPAAHLPVLYEKGLLREEN